MMLSSVEFVSRDPVSQEMTYVDLPCVGPWPFYTERLGVCQGQKSALGVHIQIGVPSLCRLVIAVRTPANILAKAPAANG